METQDYKKLVKSMDPDLFEEIFKKGVIEGTKHSAPSPETLERLNKIEASIKEITDTFMTHSQRRDEHMTEILNEFREGMKDVKQIKELIGNTSFAANIFWKVAITIGSLVVFFASTYLLIKQAMYGQN
jgi:predicted transcriptional regulator